MPRVLICIAVVSVLTCIAHAQHVLSSAGTQKIGAKSENSSSDPKVYEELFKKTFGNQRKEHMEAIKRLQKIDSYERLYKMIMVLGEKMIDVIQSSKEIIENVGFDPTNRSLLKNVTIQSAVSTTLENTALFGDILLHFPHITHRILRTQQKWNPVISWSLSFTYRIRHFLDKYTFDTIHLASQELNVIKREQGYFNPYWQSAESQKGDKEKTKKKKSTKKRGPQITKIEL